MKAIAHLLLPALLSGCAALTENHEPIDPIEPIEPMDRSALTEQVRQAELAFAATMAARDHDAFRSFLSEDAVFLTAAGPLRGKAQVADGWLPLFEGEGAPFAWEPDSVEVLDSGELALSTGPVVSPTGARLGRFTSIWRREPGGWRVVFDKSDGE